MTRQQGREVTPGRSGGGVMVTLAGRLRREVTPWQVGGGVRLTLGKVGGGVR